MKDQNRTTVRKRKLKVDVWNSYLKRTYSIKRNKWYIAAWHRFNMDTIGAIGIFLACVVGLILISCMTYVATVACMGYFQENSNTPRNFNQVLFRRHTIIVPPYGDAQSPDITVTNVDSRSESVNRNVPPLYSGSTSSPTSGTREVTRENGYNSRPKKQPKPIADGGAASNSVSEYLQNSERADSTYPTRNNSTENENVNSETPGVNGQNKMRRSKSKKARSMISTELPPLRDVGAATNISSLGNERRGILPPIQESKRSTELFTVTK